MCFLTASDLPEETKQDMFPDDLAKAYFIRMPIANEDLIKQVKEILSSE